MGEPGVHAETYQLHEMRPPQLQDDLSEATQGDQVRTAYKAKYPRKLSRAC